MGEGGGKVSNEASAVSLNTQSQTLKGLVHTSTNTTDKKVKFSVITARSPMLRTSPINIV